MDDISKLIVSVKKMNKLANRIKHNCATKSATGVLTILVLIASIAAPSFAVHEGVTLPTIEKEFIVLEIETETEATVPTDRSRKKLGVGEKVTLTLKPSGLSPITWSKTGQGTLSSTSGSSVTFTAHDRVSTDSVTATYAGYSSTVNFNVVEPNGVIMEQEAGTNVWHMYGTASAGFKGRPYFTPNDISFINIDMREQSCVGIGTGFYGYLNGIMHPVGSWISVGVGTNTKPSKSNGIDTIQSGSKGPPFSNGTFTWPIPWEFRVGSGNAKVFTTVTHQQVADSTGRVTISKGGVSVSKNANDPTSGYW